MNVVNIYPKPRPPVIPGETSTEKTVGFRLPINHTVSLVVPFVEHKIERPTSVTITNSFGSVIMVDTRIDPQTGAVSFSANKPITGFLLID